MSKKTSWMDPVLPTTSKPFPSDASNSNQGGGIGASWLDPVLPGDKKPNFKADFSQAVSTKSFKPIIKSEIKDLKRKKNSEALSAADLEAEERKRLNLEKRLARAKKWSNFKNFDQKVKLLNKRFRNRPPKPWLLDHHKEMLLSHRKKNLLKIQSEFRPAKPQQNEDEQWVSFYKQYNLPLKNQQSKLLPEVTKFTLGNFSKDPSKEKPQEKRKFDNITKDQGNVLKVILRYLEDPSVEVDISDYKPTSTLTGNLHQGPCDHQPHRLECLKFIAQKSCTDDSHISPTEANYQNTSGFTEQSSDASSVDSEDDPTITPLPEIGGMELLSKGKDDSSEPLRGDFEGSEGELDSDSKSDSSSSASEDDISDKLEAVEMIEISSLSKEVEDGSSSDASEDHMDEGLFNLLGASAFVGKKHELEVLSSGIQEDTQEIPLQEPCLKTKTQLQSKQEVLPALGSVEFISREISIILDQMVPLDLYDAVWRHTHLHQHSTLPVWDRMPICHIPISGHQMGADQNLVRAFDAFRPILPSISTFFMDAQVKAAAELSAKLGRYVHPGKAIEASKQTIVPKKLFKVVPRYCYRHVSYL